MTTVHQILNEQYGFPVEDSFWLFDPSGSDLALFAGDLSKKGSKHEEILQAISDGRLTALHSAGNFCSTTSQYRPTRKLIADGLGYLAEQKLSVEIWTNHGDPGNTQNIGGSSPSYQQGDDPSGEAYCLDLLITHGFRFFWTDVDIAESFGNGTKAGDPKPLIRRTPCRSGHEIDCFFRFRGPMAKAPDAQSLHRQLTREHLEALAISDQSVILYQHWGCHRRDDGAAIAAGQPVFNEQAHHSLQLLATARDRGFIEVWPLSLLLQSSAQSLFEKEANGVG